MLIANNLRNPAMIAHSVDGSAMCRIGKEEFAFTLNLNYVPAEYLLEFITYEAVVARLATEEATTVEELADKVFNAVWLDLCPKQLTLRLEAVADVHGDACIVITKRSER